MEGRASKRNREIRGPCACVCGCAWYFSANASTAAQASCHARAHTRERAHTLHTYQCNSTHLVKCSKPRKLRRGVRSNGFLTEKPPQSFTGKLKSSGLYPTDADQGEATNSPWLLTLHRGFGSMVVENLGFTSSEPGQSNGSAASSNGLGKKVSSCVCVRARGRD